MDDAGCRSGVMTFQRSYLYEATSPATLDQQSLIIGKYRYWLLTDYVRTRVYFRQRCSPPRKFLDTRCSHRESSRVFLGTEVPVEAGARLSGSL